MSLFDCFYECIYKLKKESIIFTKRYKIDSLQKPLSTHSHRTAAGLIYQVVVTGQERACCEIYRLPIHSMVLKILSIYLKLISYNFRER